MRQNFWLGWGGENLREMGGKHINVLSPEEAKPCTTRNLLIMGSDQSYPHYDWHGHPPGFRGSGAQGNGDVHGQGAS